MERESKPQASVHATVSQKGKETEGKKQRRQKNQRGSQGKDEPRQDVFDVGAGYPVEVEDREDNNHQKPIRLKVTI